MIVLSVGMPRAGSGWHYNLICDLMGTTGCPKAREIRKRYHLEGVLTEVNCNIGVLSLRRLAMVLIPALMGNTFVIKAHAGPTSWVRLLTCTGMIHATYIYRDPRDAMLSAYDYGRRAIAKGRPNAFSHLVDIKTTLNFMMEYVHIWEAWMKYKDVLHARYEDLLTNYDIEVTRLINFLKLDPADIKVQAIVAKYRPGKTEDGQQGLHFFKGKIGRFREKYSSEEQTFINEQLSPYLKRMGYVP